MLLSTSTLLLAASAFSTVFAAPQPLDRRIAHVGSLLARAPATSPSTSVCNVGAAKLPDGAAGLPPPSEGLVLTHVALGRGTQNYTCANNSATTVPVAAGALATLFNASCIAAPYPQLLATMTGISYKLPIPQSSTGSGAGAVFLSGHHYFSDLTTPVFDFDTALQSAGKVSTKKLNATNAPDPTKDVPWLKLGMKSLDGACGVQEVYRVNTKGGLAPKTCAGQPEKFEVQYAAEYWFYSPA